MVHLAVNASECWSQNFGQCLTLISLVKLVRHLYSFSFALSLASSAPTLAFAFNSSALAFPVPVLSWIFSLASTAASRPGRTTLSLTARSTDLRPSLTESLAVFCWTNVVENGRGAWMAMVRDRLVTGRVVLVRNDILRCFEVSNACELVVEFLSFWVQVACYPSLDIRGLQDELWCRFRYDFVRHKI